MRGCTCSIEEGCTKDHPDDVSYIYILKGVLHIGALVDGAVSSFSYIP